MCIGHCYTAASAMLPISLVVLVVLSATAPQTDCFRERRQGEPVREPAVYTGSNCSAR